MKTVKKCLFALTIMAMMFAVSGCFSVAPSAKPTAVDDLDAAIRDTSHYLNSVIPVGNKVAILNIQSDSPALSEYVIDELIANAVNDMMFSVVDRQQLDAIRAEQNFQWSGEVDDNSAQEIGRLLGAQTIVSGAINKLGSGHRIRIRALEVQTARVQGQYNRNIAASPLLADIVASDKGTPVTAAPKPPASVPGNAATSQPASGASSTAPAASSSPAAQSAPKDYKIGDTGPAGGLIFYDKGNNSGGWRYLEAAPVEETETQAPWRIRDTRVENLQTTIGAGKRNTQLIVETFSRATGEWDTAAQKCDDLEFGGFSDWFLPSRDELDQMYGNLKRRNLGNFKNEYYWASCGNIQNFGTGHITGGNVNVRYYVRPIRQVAGN